MLAWFKFQVKISGLFWICFQGEQHKYTPPSPPLGIDEGLRDIGHSVSIGNLILGVNSLTGLYLIHCDSLLQNATDIITKCNNFLITKCDRSLFQNASGFLLQNATFITNCDSAGPSSKSKICRYLFCNISIIISLHYFFIVSIRSTIFQRVTRK